jgi:hypothetical protein
MRHNKSETRHDDQHMRRTGSDRTGPDRVQDERSRRDEQHAEGEPRDISDANENVRRGQGDDASGSRHGTNSGNRPAFDRDR